MSDQDKTNQVKSKDRIPYESIDDNASLKAWNLPPMHAGDKLVRSAKRDPKAQGQADVKIEKVSAAKKPRYLTAEELQAITEEARKEGFQQGLKEGTEQGIREGTKAGEKAGNQRAYMEAKKEIEARQNQLRSLIKRLHEPMQQQDKDLENILVDLVIKLSNKIVAAEISVKPDLILNVVQRVLESLPAGANNIRVSVCESDADILESLIPDSQREWQITRDSQLASGGCKVETEQSLVDFSVEQRLSTYLEKVGSVHTTKIESLEAVPDYHQMSSSKAHQNELSGSESSASSVQFSGEEGPQIEDEIALKTTPATTSGGMNSDSATEEASDNQ